MRSATERCVCFFGDHQHGRLIQVNEGIRPAINVGISVSNGQAGAYQQHRKGTRWLHDGNLTRWFVLGGLWTFVAFHGTLGLVGFECCLHTTG